MNPQLRAGQREFANYFFGYYPARNQMLSGILGVPSPPNPDSFTDFQKIPFAKSKNGLWTAQVGGNPITIWGVIVLGTGFHCSLLRQDRNPPNYGLSVTTSVQD